MAKVLVPLEDNKIYYDGLRGVLSGIVYSMLGVYIVAVVTGEINIRELFEFPLMAINLWVVVCVFLWRRSYTSANEVIFFIGPIWFYPRVAKVILSLLYVMIGVFCSLIFNMFVKVRLSYIDIIPLFISMGIFIVLLACFSSLSISRFSDENMKTADCDEQTK